MNEFLNKISIFFSKDILFASLLPALLFLVSILTVFILLLGFDNIILFYTTMSANGVLLFTFLTILSLIALSYVLHSIRGVMLEF